MAIIKKDKRFSLVELLICISILAVLISLLSPSLKSALYSAKNTLCLNNQKSLASSLIIYADDHHDFFPNRFLRADLAYRFVGGTNFDEGDIRNKMDPYMDRSNSAWICPLYIGQGITPNNPAVPCVDSKLGTRGCVEHGIAHARNVNGGWSYIEMTNWLFAGIETAHNFKEYSHGKGGKERLGYPFTVTVIDGKDKIDHDLDLMFGEQFIHNQKSYPKVYHQPPPGTIYYGDDELNVVIGPVYLNFARDDGSSYTTIIENLEHGAKLDNILKVRRGNNKEYFAYPFYE
jgi:hypothetical protein